MPPPPPELQGWLKKRQVHGNTTRWQRRWCAFHQVRRARSTSLGAYAPPFMCLYPSSPVFRQGTVYWFSGYYKIKGNLVMTPGTVLDAPYHVKQHTKPHQFSIATPEMQRGGVCLTLQASDDDAYKRWTREIRAALEALPSVEAARTMTIRHKPGGTGGTGAALVPMASPRGSNGAS